MKKKHATLLILLAGIGTIIDAIHRIYETSEELSHLLVLFTIGIGLVIYAFYRTVKK